LNDVRSLLKKHAYTELKEISGQNFSAEPANWGNWLEKEKSKLVPCPYKDRLDIETNNGILRSFVHNSKCIH
jgi:hypothetical protein